MAYEGGIRNGNCDGNGSSGVLVLCGSGGIVGSSVCVHYTLRFSRNSNRKTGEIRKLQTHNTDGEFSGNSKNSEIIRELSKLTIVAFRKSNELEAKAVKSYIKGPADKRRPYNQLLSHKTTTVVSRLHQRQCQLIFIIRQQINACFAAASNADGFVDGCLILISTYNKCIQFPKKSNFGGSAQICNGSFTSIFLPPTKTDITYILQAITVRRSELCCLQLISNLLATCQVEMSGNESDSETSSIEILKALTSHMSSGTSPINTNAGSTVSQDPAMVFFDNMVQSRNDDEKAGKDNSLSNNRNLEYMVSNEENYFAFILFKCLQLCPSIFDSDPTNADIIKYVNKAARGLWSLTGATLEHVVLWWCSTPLACQPVIAARHLRDWLINIQYDEAPEALVSILRCFGETITVHVACTTWDKQFRLALVASTLSIDYKFESQEFYSKKYQVDGTTITGRLWSELLYTLTTFCNNCDQHSTIPSEVPIVAQIAVLHRLDHSIHTMRLWAAVRAKTLCIDWSMEMFFRVVLNDVNQCLDQIKVLRVPDLVLPDAFEVETQVNTALRAKLVSEVKVNICKLKLTYSECIDVLASISKMLSLATLSLCFPKPQCWQGNLISEKPSEYVDHFFDEVYLPVVQATEVLEILNLILKIMCESWLDYIYMKKIKFSREGALNLLRDFEGVSEWIRGCKYILPEHVEILANHEVLRTCEGVGKILLRKPFEIISMTEPIAYTPRAQHNYNSNEPESEALLPPEMFVPNQQLWLELRARSRKGPNPINCLCYVWSRCAP